MALARPFDTPGEATAILAQLSAPDGALRQLTIGQSASRTRIATTVSGNLIVPSAAAFADAGLLEAVGAVPFEASLTEQELRLADVLGLTFTVTIPGEVERPPGSPGGTTRTANAPRSPGPATSTASPRPSPDQDLSAVGALDDAGARRAQRLRDFSIWALPAWAVFFALVVVPVAYLVRRRQR